MSDHLLRYDGFCPICQRPTTFEATNAWLRDYLRCLSCPNGSVPRERAVALVLEEQRPNWRGLRIHESSPIARGISRKLRLEAQHLVQTQFYPDLALGSTERAFRNEDLQNLTFPDHAFDLFVSLDVMEHVPDPAAAVKEIFRTLAPGGAMICTWPVSKHQVTAVSPRVSYGAEGITYLKPPQYHGNPVSKDGALVTVDYGYDVHRWIAEIAPMDVRVYRFADKTHGILGEFTDVFFATRAADAMV